VSPLRARRYGDSGPLVILLHGGPGAPGHMAPIGRELADSFRVIEPFQRPSGDIPLSVATHIADLREVIDSQPAGSSPALVGSSWGAMLALAFAAAHPDLAGPIVLIGSGTFDTASRARFQAVVKKRAGDLTGDRLIPFYSYDLMTTDLEIVNYDQRANQESWADMVRLQEAGVYPAAFAAIPSPVLMLHGAVDPHPGRMILASLLPYIPQIEYREWERCGHYPWLERCVRGEFFDTLKAWLLARRAAGA
jgi:pimeloyl-ACP methyl ester carboxylesterase